MTHVYCLTQQNCLNLMIFEVKQKKQLNRYNQLGASVKNACNQGYQEDLANATVDRKLLHFVSLKGH